MYVVQVWDMCRACKREAFSSWKFLTFQSLTQIKKVAVIPERHTFEDSYLFHSFIYLFYLFSAVYFNGTWLNCSFAFTAACQRLTHQCWGLPAEGRLWGLHQQVCGGTITLRNEIRSDEWPDWTQWQIPADAKALHTLEILNFCRLLDAAVTCGWDGWACHPDILSSPCFVPVSPASWRWAVKLS